MTHPSPRSQDSASGSKALDKEGSQLPAGVHANADELIRQAGSADRAKQAVDAAANERPPIGAKDEFARQWGFASYLELFEDSKPMASPKSGHWMVTALHNGRWIVWNADDFSMVQEYPTLDEANRAAQGAS